MKNYTHRIDKKIKDKHEKKRKMQKMEGKKVRKVRGKEKGEREGGKQKTCAHVLNCGLRGCGMELVFLFGLKGSCDRHTR